MTKVCLYISPLAGILGELPDSGSHPAVQPGPLAGPSVDADQRGVGHQWPERRHRLPAQVCGLQPGGDVQEDPLHPDVRGIHRPQVTQVCPAATVRNLRVGLQTFSFFFFFLFLTLFRCSQMFSFWVCNFYFYFFGIFYILYMNLYITHMFEYIDLFLFDLKTKERIEAGFRSRQFGRGCVHIQVCVSVCVCVYVCMHVCHFVSTQSLVPSLFEML